MGTAVTGVRRFRRLTPPPAVRQGDFQHIVDGDDAEQAALVVHDRDRDQVVVGHQHGDVHHVGIRAHPDRIGVAYVDERGGPGGLEQRYQRGDPAQAALVVDRVDAGQCLGLEAAGLPHPGQRLVHGYHRGQRDEIDAHQAARAGGVEAEQGEHLGPLPGRQQVQDRLAPPLRQLRDRVGRVVRPHLGEHARDVGVGTAGEQPCRRVLVQLLEDIGLQLRVGVHPAEDLGLLLPGSFFEQVGDLRGLEPPDPGERPAQ